MSTKLSVVILTKNEEDKIARCIESVQWADEILVIDDKSSDATREIAQSLGAKVIVRSSDGNFDAQRNTGIDRAEHVWILQMDADEVVTEELKNRIIETINNPGDFAAFKFRRRNYFLGHFMRYAGEYDYWLRLFRKDKAVYVGCDIHEKIKVDGNIGTVEADIEHFAFTSITQFIERQNFYTSFESSALFVKEGILPEKVIKYNIRMKPLKIFWKAYIKKKGYKDGMYGLIWCVLSAVRRIMLWAKYWEIVENKRTEEYSAAKPQPENLIAHGFPRIKLWTKSRRNP